MLADRADKVSRKLFSLIFISADPAAPDCLSGLTGRCGRLWLDIALVVVVCRGGNIAQYIGMFFLGILGEKLDNYFNCNNKNFISSFYVWQFAHCASGGIANVMIIVILFTIVYKSITLFSNTNIAGVKVDEE